jgi:hypothetical protein
MGAVMRKILGLVLAGMMVVGLAGPAEAQTKYNAYVEVNSFTGDENPGIDVWEYRQDSQGDLHGLRYIKVCLQRFSGNSYATRSCKKTNSEGRVTWLLFTGYEYRIYVPPTAYHNPNYYYGIYP